MSTSSSDARRVVNAGVQRMEREIEALVGRVESGEPLGQLLRTKVQLQHRIQRLRDEQDTLRQEAYAKSLKNSEALRSAAIAKQKNGYLKFIGGKIRRRRQERQGQQQPNKLGMSEPKSRRAGGDQGAKNGNEGREREVSKSDISVATIDCTSPCSTSGIQNSNASGSAHKGSVAPMTPLHVDSSRVIEVRCGGSKDEGDDAEEGQAKCEEHIMDMEEESSSGNEMCTMNIDLMNIIRYSRLRMSANETHAETTRRLREQEIQKTESRRQKSMRRLMLVEEMFEKAVERRMRAMQRVAADPPADRLIGDCVVQHIPYAMVPNQLRATARTLMEETIRDPVCTSTIGATDVFSLAAPKPVLERNVFQKKFFLTSLDAADTDKPVVKESGVDLGGAELQDHQHGQDEEEGQHSHDSDRAGYVMDGPQEELLRQWRELGYTAVYLPASQRLVYPGGTGSCSDHNRRERRPYDPHAWMKLQPLPSLHLLQRRISDHHLPPHELKSAKYHRQLPPLPFSRR